MSIKNQHGSDGDEHPRDKYPLLTHARVLGADISVSQAELQCEMAGIRYPLGGSPEPVKIDAVGSDNRVRVQDRRYIAEWARRNLFDGAGPQ